MGTKGVLLKAEAPCCCLLILVLLSSIFKANKDIEFWQCLVVSAAGLYILYYPRLCTVGIREYRRFCRILIGQDCCRFNSAGESGDCKCRRAAIYLSVRSKRGKRRRFGGNSY